MAKLLRGEIMAKFFSPGQIWRLVALLFFEPRACALCQVEITEVAQAQVCTDETGGNLCPECLVFFRQLTEVRTTLIGDDDSDIIECFSSGYYSGPLQEAIYQIKYLKRPELAKILAFTLVPPAMALLNLQRSKDKNIDMKALLIPVPLHPSKVKERGFNQAEELAHHMGERLKLKVDTSSLRRIRSTRPQFGLSRGQRRRNLEGAFKASKRLNGQNVILVDDVLTSGATIYECAMAVSIAGGKIIGAITLARAKWQKREQAKEEEVVMAGRAKERGRNWGETTVPASSVELLL